LSPDARMTSFPCSAAALLPETGASRNPISGRVTARREARSVPSTPMVDICIQTAPGFMAGRTSRSFMMLSTASAFDTMVTTMPASLTASRAHCAIWILSEAKLDARSGDRSHAVVFKPPRAALRAIAAPMIPNPIIESFTLMSIWMTRLAPGRNRAQFLTANRNTQVLGRTPSYNLRFRRATADPLYAVSTRTGLQQPAWCATNNVISLPDPDL
jgi:hypothetical protein